MPTKFVVPHVEDGGESQCIIVGLCKNGFGSYRFKSKVVLNLGL